jgi:hypothetical protein
MIDQRTHVISRKEQMTTPDAEMISAKVNGDF